MRLKIRIVWQGNDLHETKHLLFVTQKALVEEVQDHIKQILQIQEEVKLKCGQYWIPSKESAEILAHGKIVNCVVQTLKATKTKSTDKKIRTKQKLKRPRKVSSSSGSDVQISYQVKQPTKKRKMESSKPKPVQKEKSPSSSDRSQSNKSTPIQKESTVSRKIQIQLPPKAPNRQANTQSSAPKPALPSTKKPAQVLFQPNIKPPAATNIPVGGQQPKNFRIIDFSKLSKSKTNSKPKTHKPQGKNLEVKGQSQSQSTKPIPYIQKTVIECAQQQKEWVDIPIKALEKYLQTHDRGFLRVGDQIQYKVTEFDQEKYMPVLSDWILAKVVSVLQKGQILLQCQGLSKKISEINFFGLKLNKATLSCQREKEFYQVSPGNQLTDTVSPTKTQQVSQPESQKTQASQVVVQLNYYFSDRNYTKDNYLIMHASRHPQLYVTLKCMMNFNKLKLLVSHVDALEASLRAQNLDNANFEIHPTQQLIRKKGLRIDS